MTNSENLDPFNDASPSSTTTVHTNTGPGLFTIILPAPNAPQIIPVAPTAMPNTSATNSNFSTSLPAPPSLNPSPLPSAHSITSARPNGTAFGVLEAQALNFWTIPSMFPADLNPVARIQYTLEIPCQTMSNQLIQRSHNQLEVFRSQTHYLTLSDIECAILAVKLEVDVVALIVFSAKWVPLYSPDKREFLKGLHSIMETRAREVSPSRKADVEIIGDRKEDEMVKLDRRGFEDKVRMTEREECERGCKSGLRGAVCNEDFVTSLAERPLDVTICVSGHKCFS